MGGAAIPLMVGGSLLNAIGNKQGPQTGVAVPPDLAGSRSNQIDLLQYLLGPTPGKAGTSQSDPLQRLQSFFGPIGMPQTDLQRQSAGNTTNMLNANAPGSAMNVLQGMLTGTGPQFERDIASANQQGGRFSSGNDILRGEALRNLFNMRTQTVGAMGALNQQGFGQGQVLAQQGDVQTQRVLQLLGGLLGLRQQATMGLPITETPNWMQSLGGTASGVGGLLPFLGGGGASSAGGGGGFSFDPSIIGKTFG